MSGSGTGTPASSGYHILTNSEAATVLRCEVTDQNMLDLLPIVDKVVEMATGRDWTQDSPINKLAKHAARLALTRLHEDPGGMAAGQAAVLGWTAAVSLLEADALILESAGVPYEPLKIVSTNIHGYMAVTTNIVIVFNHEMAAGATSAVAIQTSAGVAVAGTNTLDVTGKILTLNPTTDLTAGSSYLIVFTACPDIYGQTIDDYEIGFTTA